MLFGEFVDALKALSPQAQKKAAAAEGLAYCDKLFRIERQLQDVSPEERKADRLLRSVPVLTEFKAWLTAKSITVLPTGTTGKAVRYCINHWENLNNFLLDGRLEIENNRSERSIKDLVVGRKNWMFANTPKGATASATIYSVVETAKENGLNPLEYLNYIFEQLPNIDTADPAAVDKLLPTSAELPDEVRLHAKTQ